MSLCTNTGGLVKIFEPPLSVNQAWQGRRFKTPKYKGYEKLLLLSLPPLKLPKSPLKIVFTFGFSNSLSDCDNPVKPLMDILQKKYGFNDRDVYKLEIFKIIVNKGEEFSGFFIDSICDNT